MSEQLVNLGSIMGKDVLNLTDGTLLGKVQSVVIGEDNKVSGIKVRKKAIGSGVMVIPFAAVKAFGSMVTVLSAEETTDGRDFLGKTVITMDGTTLGRVWELAFDAATGEVKEVMLKGSLLSERLDDKGVLPGEKIVCFGKDVVIAAEGINMEDFQVPQEEFYGDGQAVDDLLNEMDATEAGEDLEADDIIEESYEEVFDDMTESISKTIERTIRRVKDEVTSDKFKEQTEKFIDNFGEQTKGLLSELREKIKQIDTDSIKEEIRSKVGQKDEHEELAFMIVGQLKGKTVEKPLLNEDGTAIVWPGQVIGLKEAKQAIQAGKLQELLELATVSLYQEEVKEDEIEVEIIVAEGDSESSEDEEAFIQETVAQMEEAEKNE